MAFHMGSMEYRIGFYNPGWNDRTALYGRLVRFPFVGRRAVPEFSLGSTTLACLAFFMSGLWAAVGIFGIPGSMDHVVRLKKGQVFSNG